MLALHGHSSNKFRSQQETEAKLVDARMDDPMWALFRETAVIGILLQILDFNHKHYAISHSFSTGPGIYGSEPT